jgi:hypothetical protein
VHCFTGKNVFPTLQFSESFQELAQVRDENMIAHMLMVLPKFLPKSKFLVFPQISQ